ncbi:MFS transporter [Rubrobacter indicoceani]|uniref:MFS transporter n=1 Tax=Rubrobacter indicoceani TaxID=2051957 RepID=UPI000E5A8B78|nr:MFS transporter [Rubrobacter indicoceani]
MDQPNINAVRRAVTALFFVNGMATATWFVRIPAVKSRLDISAGELSLALLAVALGSIVMMLFASGLVERFGAGRNLIAGSGFLAVGLSSLGLSPSLFALCGAGVLLGVGNGLMNVALNARASEIQAEYGRAIMPSFHAWLSLGGFVAATIGGLVAAGGVPASAHLTATAAGLVLFGAIFYRVLFRDAKAAVMSKRIRTYLLIEEDSGVRRFAMPGPLVVLLGLVGFSVLFGEGAMADWSAVYLRSLGTTEAVAAAGFALFSLTMAMGRLTGGWLTNRLGQATMIRAGGTLGAVGLSLGLIGGTPTLALVGFTIVGLGFSTVFPLVLSAAGEASRVPSRAIAFVSVCGYGGLLLGPAAIGLLAELTAIRLALVTVVALSIFVAAAGGLVAARKPEPALDSA